MRLGRECQHKEDVLDDVFDDTTESFMGHVVQSRPTRLRHGV